MLTPQQAHARFIESHRAWLARFPAAYAGKWEQLLSANEEAALVEAHVREILVANVESIRPFEDAAHGGPDFECLQGQNRFYAEASALGISSVSKATNLRHEIKPGPTFHTYRDLTRLIQARAKKKANQCSELDAPCLLAIGTLHFEASTLVSDELHMQHVLISETGLSMEFDEERGEAKGPMIPTTDLQHSAVLGVDDDSEVEAQRRSVSALLIAGLGTDPVHVKGMLHPGAVRPFSRALLPRIRFCELDDGYRDGRFRPVWT